MFDINDFIKRANNFKINTFPFNHCVIDDFFDVNLIKKLESEMYEYSSLDWYVYKNAIEDKRALNNWNLFPPTTYKFFSYLLSNEFVSALSGLVDNNLFPDHGLHGGGWHMHGGGGYLNPHLDYSIHPKLRLERRLNLIIYISSEITENDGGDLGLWTHDAENNTAGELVKLISPKFNRAVIFDTTMNSWHGMCKPMVKRDGLYRKSLATYYLQVPKESSDPRVKALFAAREEQKGDRSVQELIKARANESQFFNVYRTDEK
ncbi:MAG: hypothetical protein EoVTN8_408 [Fluviibacter phosphoraccumulans EoVTN8]